MLKLSDIEIAEIAGCSQRDFGNWRHRGFLPKRNGGPAAVEDIALAYVIRILAGLGLGLADAAFAASRLVPILLAEKESSGRIVIGLDENDVAALVLDAASVRTEIEQRMAAALERQREKQHAQAAA
jgi:hypothetical protein